MGDPLVSIIVPFFNAEAFIEDAIKSVIGQTYRNWELLLVDDGSRDRSPDIARHHAKRHPNIHYVTHEDGCNRGTSISRNLGIDHSSGSLIAFLDADDVWLSHKLSEQISVYRDFPGVGMVYGRPRYWYSWSGRWFDRLRDHRPRLPVPENTLTEPPTLLFASYPLGRGAAPCPSDVIIRRAAVLNVGGFEECFVERYNLYEDQAFLVKLYLEERVFVSGAFWTSYRQHSGSFMANFSRREKYDENRRFFLNWLAEYLAYREIRDEKILNLLQESQNRQRRKGLGFRKYAQQ